MAGVAVATTATMAVMTAPAVHAISAVLIRVNICVPLLFRPSDPGIAVTGLYPQRRTEQQARELPEQQARELAARRSRPAQSPPNAIGIRRKTPTVLSKHYCTWTFQV